MKGLLMKDLLNLKEQGRLWLVMLAAFSVVGVAQGNVSYVIGVASMIMILLPVNAMAYDEQAKWDGYALTMPFTRRALVLERYALALMAGLASGLLVVTLSLLMREGLAAALMQAGSMVCVGLGMVAVALPILFKLGVQKGRLAMTLTMLAPLALMLFPEQVKAAVRYLDGLTFTTAAACGVGALAVLAGVSVALSLRFYGKKEF